MTDRPDIATIAGLIGDPRRSAMLLLLREGHARTASELAGVAGISAPTASGHLAKMHGVGLVKKEKRGRHRLYSLARSEVTTVLDALLTLANPASPAPTPSACSIGEELRLARSCYGHLGGEIGTQIYRSLMSRHGIREGNEGQELTPRGRAILLSLGLDVEALSTTSKGAACLDCDDWSIGAPHLGGYVGRGLLSLILSRGWAAQDAESRAIHFTENGRNALDRAFPPQSVAVDA